MGSVDLARAQRSLPWWLRPPLPDAADLRYQTQPLNMEGISDALDGDGSMRVAKLASSGSLADLAGSALLKVASLADLTVPGLARRNSMDGLLAVSQPLRSVSARLLASLPAELSSVLADACDVFLAAAFNRGDRQTAERQIRECLRVASLVASHLTSTIAFNWAGRRKLLGGLAALEDMLSIDGGEMPPLLSLLSARERQYMAELQQAAEPVGRHATGAGRSTARDPLSFGFEGSFVLDEDAHKALKSPAAAGAVHVHGTAAVPSKWPWLRWPHNSLPKQDRKNIYVEEAVPVAALFESLGSGVGPSYDGRFAELVARRHHAGVGGTAVCVLRYPPNWSAVAPFAERSTARTGSEDAVDTKGSEGSGGSSSRPDAKPLWFHAVVTGLRPESQSCDLEYAPVQMETRFGDACDGATLNILLPDLCISVEGLVVDLIDRAGLAGQLRRSDAGRRGEAAASLIAARWIEPSAAQREEGGLLGTLLLRLEQPVLFHLVAEAARLTLVGKGALFVLNRLIGERTLVRIEADVELAHLSVRLACREAGIYLSISELELELARDGDVRCRSAEGGFVEWLVRAIPAVVLAWIKKALQFNLRKEQLICPWQGDTHVMGVLDGLVRNLARLEQLKESARRMHSPSYF